MMGLYVTLGKYTSEAMKNIAEVPQRLEQNTRLIESKGGKLVAFYWLMGEWDILAITESPDVLRAGSCVLHCVEMPARNTCSADHFFLKLFRLLPERPNARVTAGRWNVLFHGLTIPLGL
jgi:uncharacterized protein with GYD domain